MTSKSWRRYLTLGFLLAVGLPEIGTTTLAQPARRKLTINLYVYNYAQAPERTLREAENQAGEIFRKIGVKTLWVQVPLISREKPLEFLSRRSQNSSGLDLRISIPPRLTVKTMERHLGRRDHVFGLSMYSKDKPGHLAYVFYHRIEEFVRARNLAQHKARILGLAIAHEIGHLLLPLHSHSSRGVMRATWDREDFELAARGNLDFTPKQAELIRSEVLRRSASNPEIISAHEALWEKYMATAENAYQQTDYAETEQLYLAALKEAENFGDRDTRLAITLNNLGDVYQLQGKYSEAKELNNQSLDIFEKVLGPEHSNVATSLYNLASVYQLQGKYNEAERLYKRTLAIWEKALGPEHPSTAASLNNLGLLYREQGRYDEAEPLFQRSLSTLEKALGPDHLDVATSLINLADLYLVQDEYVNPQPLYQRALAIREKTLGADHPKVATTLGKLATLYDAEGRDDEAEQLYRRTLAILERIQEANHPTIAQIVENYTAFLSKQNRETEAN